MSNEIEVLIYRKYDGYTHRGIIKGQTPHTLDIQLPGYSRPIRFRRLRNDPTKLRNSTQDLYLYWGQA